MAQRLLSIDIREDVVCGVMLSFGSRIASVVECGISVPGERTIGEAVAEVLDEVGYTGEPCRISLGAENFFYRNLSFPFSDKRKIEKILAIELEGSVVVDMDELLVDSLISGKKGEESSVVAAMIDRELLQAKLDELADVHLDPEIIAISNAQTALQLSRLQEESDFVLLDAGCRRVTLFVIFEGRMRLIRTIAFDDGSLANFIIDKNSQQVAPRRPEKVDASFASLCREVRHTLFALEDIDPQLPLYLTGALADVPNAAAYLERQLDCEVRSCDLAGDQQINIGLECGLWRSDLMTPALALGLRAGKKQLGFNFRKEEFVKRISFEKYKKHLPRVGIPAAVCLAAAIIFFWNDLSLKEKELGRLTDQGVEVFSSTLPEVTRIVDPVKQLSAEVKEMKKGTLGEASNLTDIKVLDLMAEISVRVPQSINVHVVRMVADRNAILLRGLTDNFNSVDSLKKVLEKSDYFSAVTINSANLSRKGSGIRFELKVELNRG